MSKDNRDFFKKKSEWAKTKDKLLENYLVPYATKILYTNQGLLYIDSFAGKGMFDDGAKGSPIIACESIEKAIAVSNARNKNVHLLFIEKSYADELSYNMASFQRARVMGGTFELLRDQLQSIHSSINLFLYIDPFGIRSLDMDFFLGVAERFNTVEILLNFNSFGFFRAACSLNDLQFSDVESFDDIIEREVYPNDSASRTREMLNKAAGGEYWQQIVDDYRDGEIDGYEAESRLADKFCERLMNRYKYVLNLPIRLRTGGRPKYRMIHITNHEDGCLLMYDQMQREQVRIQDIQQEGQLSFFARDSNEAFIDERAVRENLLAAILEEEVPTKLEIVLAKFVIGTGLSLSIKRLREMVGDFERQGAIKVIRCPEMTRSGNPTRFMESDHGNIIAVGNGNG